MQAEIPSTSPRPPAWQRTWPWLLGLGWLLYSLAALAWLEQALPAAYLCRSPASQRAMPAPGIWQSALPDPTPIRPARNP